MGKRLMMELGAGEDDISRFEQAMMLKRVLSKREVNRGGANPDHDESDDEEDTHSSRLLGGFGTQMVSVRSDSNQSEPNAAAMNTVSDEEKDGDIGLKSDDGITRGS